MFWVKVIQSKTWRDNCVCCQICYNAPSSGYEDQFSHVSKRKLRRTQMVKADYYKHDIYLFSLKAEKYIFQACLSKNCWIKVWQLYKINLQFLHIQQKLQTILHVNWLGLSAFTERLLKNPLKQNWGQQETKEVVVLFVCFFKSLFFFFFFNAVLHLLRNWTRHWMLKIVHISLCFYGSSSEIKGLSSSSGNCYK